MKNFKNMLNKFILAVLLGVATIANAQDIDKSTYFSKSDEILTGTNGLVTSLVINQINKTSSLIPLNEKNVSAKLYLKLDLGEDYFSTDAQFNYEVGVEINIIGGLSSSYSKNLIISKSNPEQIVEINLLSDFNSINAITGINVTNTVSTPLVAGDGLIYNYVTSNARITATLVREYGVDVRLPANIMAPGVHLTNPTPTGRRVLFDWSGLGSADFANYEVQILRLYNTDINQLTNNSAITAEVDWNKALRVETQSSEKSIELTIAEGTGFYVWRVRPIGNFFPGGIANQENYGVWSVSTLTPTVTLTQTDAANRNEVIYFTDPDENINWIYNRVFTEGNIDPLNTGVKVSEGMSYADGLLRARQTQAYNSSNSSTLVTQTVSDYSGRPALTTLPAPLAGGLEGYKVGFVQNGNGGVYTAIDYDKDSNIVGNTYVPNLDNIKNPEPVKDDAATGFNYYDGTNANGVADAEGYAFKRTIFKTDGTGRVHEESGVGKMHALGTQGGTLGGGRTTRILFGTPSDDELIRIFGDEAPLAESVIKTITIDPNNVVSATYTSKEGKTIATALITTETSNLKDLDGETVDDQFVVSNTANQNIVSNKKMISSRRIALEIPKDVTLSYKNTVAVSMGACAGGNCNLKIRFYLNNLTNGETFVSDADISTAEITSFDVVSEIDFTNFTNWGWVNLTPNGSAFVGTITSPSTSNDKATTFHLQDGEYIVTKEVYSTNDENYLENQLISYSEKYIPIFNALADKMITVVNPTDYTNFQTIWMPGLKALIDAYIIAPSTAGSDAIVTYLSMDVAINHAWIPDTSYVFPVDFTIPNNFLNVDSGDPTQNTLTISSGCCGSMEIPLPKPEICDACEGEDDSEVAIDVTIEIVDGEPVVTETATIDLIVIEELVDDEIALSNYGPNSDVNFSFGIEDVRNIVLTHSLSTQNTELAYGGDAWRIINKIVEAKFMRYLLVRLHDEGLITLFTTYSPYTDPNLQPVLDRFAPGFTYTSMQYMITNMLVSKYYTGQSKLDGGTNFRAKENATTGFLEFIDAAGIVSANGVVPVTGINDVDEYNYDNCKKLYECWLQAVDMINTFDFPDDINVMDSFNDEQNDPSGSDDHADDDDSKEEGNWVIDKITSWVISQKMRNAHEKIDKESMEALVSLPKLFMQCAGYNYAAILDEESLPTVYTDYFSTTPFGGASQDPNIVSDFSTYSGGQNHGAYTPFLVYRNDQGDVYIPTGKNNSFVEIECGDCNPEKILYYPYVLKPEWMFKYFVYNAYSNNSYDNYIPVLNQFEVELNSCYQDLYNPICSLEVYNFKQAHPSTLVSKCSGDECRYNHESWSAGQRLNFYKQIIGASKCPLSCEVPYDAPIIGEVVDCNKEVVVGYANNQLADALNVCETRRNEFKGKIIQELQAGCWQIVTCSSEVYHITEAQIELMVNQVVDNCKAQVGVIQDDLDLFEAISEPYSINYGSTLEEFPKCIDGVCFYVDFFTDPSLKTCASTPYKTITLFPECDQTVLNQINSWDFEPIIGVANLNGDNLYGLNPDGTPKDAADVSQCAKYSQKEWVPGCTSTSCSTQGCNHVDGNGNTVTNIYSSKHIIPPAP